MTLVNKFESLISERSKRRKGDFGFYNFTIPENVVKHPNPLPLGGGMPTEEFFPVKSIHFNLIEEPFKKENKKNQELLNDDDHLRNDTFMYSDKDEVIDISTGLQYSGSYGLPPLLNFCTDLIKRTNQPAYDDWDVIVTNGSGDSLHKIAELFLNNGGTVLVEEFTFTPFISIAENFGATAIPIKMNIRPKDGEEQGMDPDYLDDLMTHWSDSDYKHLPKPRVLYTIPTGQNPTGLSQSFELRKKIYSIAEKHNFVIVEDDPYGYLSLPKYGTENIYVKELNNDVYIQKHLKASYLTLDTSGRVLRLETFSKLFAPGLRLGFIVANKYFNERISINTGTSTRQPSGIAQLMFNNIVQDWGGVDGWLNWAKKIAKHYTIRRDLLLKTFYESKSYSIGQFDIVEPDAGMFIIAYINIESRFPDPKTWENVLLELRYKTITNGIDVIFGNRMVADLDFKYTTPKSNFLRITIAAVQNNEQLVEAAQRLTKSIEQFFEELDAGKFDHLK